VQVKLWDLFRTCAIPERFEGVVTTRRYTNRRLYRDIVLYFTYIAPFINAGDSKRTGRNV